MRMRKKKWVAPFLESENRYLLRNPKSLATKLPVYLEIGMGMGDFITQSANANKDVFYLGLERDETCVARAIQKAEELELENFQVILGNAVMIGEMFDESSIDRIYLHFSDPWPKKGHHKRRLTYGSFLEMYARILKPHGDLVFKTDNRPFFDDSLEYFANSAFKTDVVDYDYHRISRSEPMTGYEAKFSALGEKINYAHFLLDKDN